MFNPYNTKHAVIKKIFIETDLVKRFLVEFKFKKDCKNFEFIPGQIIELSLPGYNEAPFAICSSALKTDSFEITIRKIGKLTEAVHNLKPGDIFGIRGPYGNGFPIDVIKSRNLLIIAGGIGLIPFRSLLMTIVDDQKKYSKNIQVFYGAKSEREILFKSDYKYWKKKFDFHITIDEGRRKKIAGDIICDIGLITELFQKVDIDPDSIAVICGPPVMCQFVINKLKELNFKDEEIYLSLERKMECAVGVCEHCAIGSKFVCKDGPIFQWSELKNIKGAV